MTKQDKIKEAYGEYWDNFIPQAKECALKNDGWISSILEHAPKSLELEFENYQYRPKSLQGIENNNGWIKIESEADLPTKEVDCHIIYNNNLMTFAVWDNVLKGFYIGIVKQNPTHYQPIKLPEPPIY